MAKRIGLGKGKGKGYKNLAGRDPKIHSDSSKGRKQPQKIGVIIPSKADMPFQKVERVAPATKTQRFKAFASEKYEQTKKYGQSKIERLKEKRKQKKIEELEAIHHPLTKQLIRQEERVDTLKTQISEAEDENKEEKLFDELAKEQEQLRTAQEKITNLKVEDLSDRELKTLAIRYVDNSLFGSDNPYTKELKRRIGAEKTIEKTLKEEREREDSGSIFDF